MRPACHALSFSACLLIIGLDTTLAQENNQPPAGFTAIFNGKDLTGWYGGATLDPRKQMSYFEALPLHMAADKKASGFDSHWRVENGELVNDGKGLYATTTKEYGDIELWIDYKTVPVADSGIYLRATPQVQIWDFTETGPNYNRGANKGSGGLYNNSPRAGGKDPLVLADKPFGEWNRFRIKQVGDKTWVWLNGKLVVDGARMENIWDKSHQLPLIAKGPIQLQTHGGEIRWRNIFVREIPADEANALLRGKDPAGFEPIFNGKDFTGWTGATDNYEVANGAVRCRAGQGGNLFTKEEYGDFVVRLEFKVPEAGNNGLAIRFSGKGDPSVDGMCELQVLDSEHPRYASLDPRQAHGSAYGIMAAHRGYLRPAGQWNYQQVTVKGSTIVVELNGTTILDGDLSKVTRYMHDKAHPGKDRPKGHFGFAGHNDPVEFRNISIKKL